MIPGFRKIEYLYQQAVKDGLDWAWIDTCCIDKTNSTELAEAINSMFDWYNKSQVCYAYLADVETDSVESLISSCWWSRAWTLQELLAPRKVIFYNNHWNDIGTKAQLARIISKKRGIDKEVLAKPALMYTRSIAQRMSWASLREATRIEDVAYSLLGIFGIHMSMKYGEGVIAFERLQKKIMKSSNDQSLFAWSFSPHALDEITNKMDHDITQEQELSWQYNGIFVDHPRDFSSCGDIIFHKRHALDFHIGEFNGALRIMMPLDFAYRHANTEAFRTRIYDIGLLPCGYKKNPNFMVGLLLEEWTPGRYRRVSPAADLFTFLVDCQKTSGYLPRGRCSIG